MPSFFRSLLLSLVVFALPVCSVIAPICAPQSQQLALTLGVLSGSDRTAAGNIPVSLKSGVALEANYAHRIKQWEAVQLFAGVHFLANGARAVQSSSNFAPRSVASLYVTPDVALKFAPHRKFQPWLTIGGGYAQYESSKLLQDHTPNPDPVRIHRLVLEYGGGVDFSVLPWLAFRGEVRDFYSGNPRLNVAFYGGLHNIVPGGGFVIKF